MNFNELFNYLFGGLSVLTIIGLIIFILGILLFFPFIIIWSLNTLFALAIPYTIKTWFAMLILANLFSSSKIKFRG